MHWNLPVPTAATTTTTMTLEETGGDVGAFQAREMSDVIENIIRQQHQQQAPVKTDYSGLHSVIGTPLQHNPQHNQLAVATTATADSLQLFLGQTAATTGGSTHGFISSFSPVTVTIRPVVSSLDASSSTAITADASDWINRLSGDLTDNKLAGHAITQTLCPSDEGPDAEIEAQVQAAMSYWLHPDLPDENVMLADRHWDVLNRVVPAYNRFVQFGTNVNRKLKIKFDVSLGMLLLATSSYLYICSGAQLYTKKWW